MKKINRMSASEIDDLKQDFERVMRTTYDFLTKIISVYLLIIIEGGLVLPFSNP
jgi:hypothetical protein